MSLARAVARRVKGGVKRRANRVLERLGFREEPVPEAPPAPEPADDVVGAPVFTFEQVDELLDDMVRPALQADGGDITLVRVDHGDIYVQLVGACSTCPSATATMRMGIERLLEEELPGFRNLIEVNGVGH